MNKTETAKALAVIQEVYPHFMDGRTPEPTAEIWLKMFPSETYAQVEAAVLAFVASDTRGFPPSIGQIKEKLAQMDPVNEIDEAKAWALVAAALRRSGSGEQSRVFRNGVFENSTGAEQEFMKLPPEVQRAVGTPSQLQDWARMDIETLNSVVSSNFMRSYRARASYIREVQKLPKSVQRMYELAGDALSMDRAFLPTSDKPEEPPATQPAEEKPMPESVKSIRDSVQKQVLQDQVESAKNQTHRLMGRMFGQLIQEAMVDGRTR